MHPQNKHKNGYDFNLLTSKCPDLTKWVMVKFGKETIDFSHPTAVKELNKALLKTYYQIEYWDIPEGFLCPPIPGRVDYLHHIKDLLGDHKKNIRGLDIGTGASCIYPILGVSEFLWTFIAADIDERALKTSEFIIQKNEKLKNKIELRKQDDPKLIFQNIIQSGEQIDFTICNPPFHSSQEEASTAALRKIKNLKLREKKLNFGGMSHELWCQGGEREFVKKMIKESVKFKNQVRWFTTLISKSENLRPLQKSLEAFMPKEVRIIEMNLGQKASRILAWTY